MIEFTFLSGSDTLFIKSEKITAVKAVKSAGFIGIDTLHIYMEGTSEPISIDRRNIKSMKINGKIIDSKKTGIKTLARKIAESE